MGRTFVEKIFDAPQGEIVFSRPDIVLSHDNTASIRQIFEKMNGEELADPDQLLIVLDHNAPPTNAKLATDYQEIRDFARTRGIKKFYDAGRGICHQLMSNHAMPGMIIVGSDSHTCTAGAFNAMAAGIDRTETAGIWKRGETWFKVPDSMKIILSGQLREGVYAKDLSLWIIGQIGSAGANYRSIEFHGEGIRSLGMAERMTLANLASEMGAKNAVFPPDEVLENFFGSLKINPVWADFDAQYVEEINIDLSEVLPLVAAPHHVDLIKTVQEVEGIRVQQGLIGTCTNGRIEDLREAAAILRGRQVAQGFQLLVVPASRDIYLQAIEEGLITTFLGAGANVLSASCGPCLGTGQGIPADGFRVISTANRNFKGRMGNKEAEIYLASPATVASTAINGKIASQVVYKENPGKFRPDKKPGITAIAASDPRRFNAVWNYADVNNLNTDQMFAGNLTYTVSSADPASIITHLFAGFDPAFAKRVGKGDIILAGENFGCGSSREHPAVGLAFAGVKALIVKSVNRIFFRSSVNQGLILIVQPELVESYRSGDKLSLNLDTGTIELNDRIFNYPPLPGKLLDIISKKGLVNWVKEF